MRGCVGWDIVGDFFSDFVGVDGEIIVFIIWWFENVVEDGSVMLSFDFFGLVVLDFFLVLFFFEVVFFVLGVVVISLLFLFIKEIIWIGRFIGCNKYWWYVLIIWGCVLLCDVWDLGNVLDGIGMVIVGLEIKFEEEIMLDVSEFVEIWELVKWVFELEENGVVIGWIVCVIGFVYVVMLIGEGRFFEDEMLVVF